MSRIHNRRKNRGKTAFFLGIMLLLNGCGQTEAVPPTLQEPVAVNAAYRAVEYGSIGKIEVLFGTVVPTDYCHYYDANVNISQIMVEVGDQVQEGDILALADVEAAKEELADCKEQLASENTSYELNCKISQTKRDEWNYQKEAARAANLMTEAPAESTESSVPAETTNPAEMSNTGEVSNTSESVEPNTEETSSTEEFLNTEERPIPEDFDSMIALEQENARYDALLHEYRVKKLQESIASLEEIIADGTLTARHSGQVTFTKNIAKGRQAGANENIVVVSDLEDTHLELTDTNVQDYKYADYEVKYISLAGEKLPVTEEEYSTEELVLAKVNQHYPNVRIQCPEAGKLTIGDTYPVYFIKKEVQNVLVIGNDSLYQEGEEYYVYVADDAKEKEKRIVTIGAADENYTQITDGLVEGELVYYDSDARMPAKYTNYTVELSDFSIENHGTKYDLSDANTFSSISSWEGDVADIAVIKGQEISKGDLLYTIDTGEGKAAMTEAQNAINQENQSYEKLMTEYQEQITSLSSLAAEDGSVSYEIQILEYQKQLATLNHNDSLKELQKNYSSISEGNDGSGMVSVYAENDGTISAVVASKGDKVEEGSEMLRITTQSTDVILVQMEENSNYKIFQDNIADVGERVVLKSDNKTWEGTCVGWAAGTNNTDKGYVYTDENGVHLSYNTSSGYNYPAFYVRMDDTSFSERILKGYSMDFSYLSMKDVIVLPASMVYAETDPLNESKVSYYVWRIEGEELVKQYVLVSSDLADSGKQVVLSGVQAGDILARE